MDPLSTLNATGDDLYNINNYEQTELYDILGLPDNFNRSLENNDQKLANAILKQIQKFSNIAPGQDSNSKEAKSMAKFFLDIYEYFFPDKTVSDSIQRTYDDENPDTTDDIASSYTDEELYQLLGLDNPSDQLLEAKLTLLISQYSKFKNAKNNTNEKQLYNLYKNIYAHFFSENDQSADPPVKNATNAEWEASGQKNLDDLNSEINMLKTKTTPPATNDSKPPPTVVSYTKQLDYSQGALNPILKQTTTRVVSIDSQYRSDKTKISTEFTFNLSEPLKDVVSLRLYSIQIPYTWYTIGTAFGNNLFYFKGRTSGIDNSLHDVKVEILPGNYTPSVLISTVNESIRAIASTNYDTSMGNTAIAYNPNNSLCTTTVDLSKSYNESSYSILFSGWSSPYLLDSSRNISIPAYLGFQTNAYSANIIHSAPIFEDVSLNSDSSKLFFVNNSNKYATIVLYSGTDTYTHGTSPIDMSFNISLSLPSDLSYSRAAIMANLNTQIQASPLLVDSYIQRTNIDVRNTTASTTSYFEMKIKPNRFNVSITQNTQTFVVFPQTTPSLWTGETSCFKFDNIAVHPVNRIISDVPTVLINETYSVVDSPYIEFKCVLSGFNTPNNDISLNLLSSASADYTLDAYLSLINNSISAFDSTHGGYLNASPAGTYAYIDDETFKMNLVMNKTFPQSDFILDLTDSVLYSVYDISFSGSPIIQNIAASYSISLPTTIGAIQISPNQTIANVIYKSNQDVSYNITFPSDLVSDFYDVKQVANLINNAFNNYIDAASNLKTFQGFSFSPFTISGGNFVSTLSPAVNKTLVPANYTIQFKSVGGNSSWKTNLFMDASMVDLPFPLLNTESTIYTRNVLTNTVILSAATNLTQTNPVEIISGINDTISIIANENGVSSSDGANNVVIRIDAGTYSRNQLITAINHRIQTSATTSKTDITGTRFDIIYGRPGSGNTTDAYLRITFRAKRAYTSSDYNLIFYDKVSFTTCFTGASSVRNTTWDTTIGWIMGFRKYISYDLSATFENESTTIKTVDSAGRILIYGDTGVSTNLYNYFLICLDDYNQNRLNDGLVTITNVDSSIPLPSYASRSEFVCDPITGNRIFNSSTTGQTAAQTYAANVAVNSVGAKNSIGTSVSSAAYGTGPYVSDVFGIIPIKSSGLLNGSAYVDYGGSLQNQERFYFGPVNIHRMTVRLVNDRGDLVDLNNANWSFSLICEQLNKLNPGK